MGLGARGGWGLGVRGDRGLGGRVRIRGDRSWESGIRNQECFISDHYTYNDTFHILTVIIVHNQ